MGNLQYRGRFLCAFLLHGYYWKALVVVEKRRHRYENGFTDDRGPSDFPALDSSRFCDGANEYHRPKWSMGCRGEAAFWSSCLRGISGDLVFASEWNSTLRVLYPYSDTCRTCSSITKVYGCVKNHFPLWLATANARFYIVGTNLIAPFV